MRPHGQTVGPGQRTRPSRQHGSLRRAVGGSAVRRASGASPEPRARGRRRRRSAAGGSATTRSRCTSPRRCVRPPRPAPRRARRRTPASGCGRRRRRTGRPSTSRRRPAHPAAAGGGRRAAPPSGSRCPLRAATPRAPPGARRDCCGCRGSGGRRRPVRTPAPAAGRRARRGRRAVADGEQRFVTPTGAWRVTTGAAESGGRGARCGGCAAMRALVGVTALGFASYCLTLASLPVYAVAGGAAESTAGVVTAVFLAVTIAVQAAIPALTARFGAGPVLVAGLLALGVPSPFYVLGDGLGLAVLRSRRCAAPASPCSPCSARRSPPRWRRRSAAASRSACTGWRSRSRTWSPSRPGWRWCCDGHAAWLAWLAACPVLGVALVPAAGARGRRRSRRRAARRGPGRAARCGRRSLRPLVLFVVTLAGGGLVTFLPIERPDGALATGGAAALRRHRGADPLARRAAGRPARQPAAAARVARRGARWGWSPARRAATPGTPRVLVGAARVRRRLTAPPRT